MRLSALLLALLASWGASATSPSDETPQPEPPATVTVLVIDPPQAPLEQALRTEVSARFTHGLSTVARYSVTSSADLRRLLDLEANRQMAGCTSGECLAEIGDALGASRALAWSATRRTDVVTIDFALYETKTGAVLGRGQAQANDDGLIADVERALDQMLREVLRKESAADPVVAARARYDEEQLAVVDRRNWLGTVPTPVEGVHNVPIEWNDFYRRAGREDLAEEDETRSTVNYVAISAIVIGVGMITAGGYGYFHCDRGGPSCGLNDEQLAAIDGLSEEILAQANARADAVANIWLAIASVGGIVLAASVVTPIVFADRVPIEVKRKIAEDHNELLRERLSLPRP